MVRLNVFLRELMFQRSFKTLVLCLLTASSTLLADTTWIGNDPFASNPPFGDPLAWDAGVPNSADIAIFPNVLPAFNFLDPTIALPPNPSVLGVRFVASAPGNNYNIQVEGTRTFTIGTQGIQNPGGLDQTITVRDLATLNVRGNVAAGVDLNVTSTTATINLITTNNLLFDGTLTAVASNTNTGLTFDGGIITLTSDSSGFLQNANVATGTLVLTGTLGSNSSAANGSLTVAAGARLEGNGTVGNNLNLFGTIDPGIGNNVGRINIGGNFLANTGTYEAHINANRQPTLIDVAGSADLDMANLIVKIDFSDVINGGVFRILTADSINAPFATVTTDSANPLVDVQQILRPQNLFVAVSVPQAQFVDTTNEFNVLASLSSITDPTPDQLVILTAVANLPGGQVGPAMNQMSGEQYTNFVEVGYNAVNRFSNRLRMATRSRIACPQCCTRDYFGWFDAGSGKSYYTGDALADGLDNDFYTFSAGVQVLDCCGWTLGLAACYEKDDLDFDRNGSADMDIYQGAFYASYNNPWGYFLSNLIYGCQHFKMKRNIQFDGIDRLASSSGKVYSGTYYGELGITNPIFCLETQQYIGVELGYFYQHKLSESGADSLNLEIGASKNYHYDAVIGTRFLYKGPCCTSLELDLNYRRRMNSEHVVLNNRFVDVELPMKIRGFKLGRNGVEGSLVLMGTLCGNFQWYLRATGDYWSDYRNYSGTAGVILHW